VTDAKLADELRANYESLLEIGFLSDVKLLLRAADQLDAQGKRIEALRVALKEIVKNERGGGIPSITSMIATDALTTDKEPKRQAQCHACQLEDGAKVPPQGQRGITVHEGTCPKCGWEKQRLVPAEDYDWPEAKAVWD
jgi:hypothetical protein